MQNEAGDIIEETGEGGNDMTAVAKTTPDDRQWMEEGVTEEAAAQFLGCSKWFLEKLRKKGGGPRFNRLSPKIITYKRRHLIEFQESKAFTSTSEYDRQESVPET